jgi:hypothetical protein
VSHCIPIWLRSFSTTEVTQSPRRISKHAQFTTISDKRQKRFQRSLAQNIVATGRTVTSDVAKRPDSLLTDVRLVTAQQLNKDGDSASLDDNLCLLCRSRGNICQGPGRFKLDECMR